MKKQVYLAVDLGASNGRVLAGVYDGKSLCLDEVNRFPNAGHALNGHFHWNAVGLFTEIKAGLANAARLHGRSIASVGVDTWGVDYGLLDRDGFLLGVPFQYRDKRTDGMMERTFRRVGRRSLYEATGIQFMFFNTIFQLMSEVARTSPALAAADRLLFTPDLIHFWLSGRAVNEYTIASTSQLLDARTRRWSAPVIRRLGAPAKIFGKLVNPGTVLGPLLPEVAEETGLRGVRVVAPGSHDTASAVAAVPAVGSDFVYLSSGTWSLMGVETRKPVITEQSYKLGFTNEGGVCGTIRLLKNICGLWLLQECRRAWKQRGQEVAFEDLRSGAASARPFTAFIDPDHPDFAKTCDMPARIAAFCRRTGQKAPKSHGEIARVVYESLALRYREVFGELESLTGKSYPGLHIVGGGSRESLLNQYTADALQRPVMTGPVEATAIGNVLMQMIALKRLPSLAAGRELVRSSFGCVVVKPGRAEGWDEAYARFQRIKRIAAG
ncbi:MAG TPA: rhamnulokinase family protein [Kiritimatiellia bacterium]|nr:rhamnulokinase family protein [Kiritimatiellia bacterium]